MIIALLLIAGYLVFAYAIKKLAGQAKLDAWELFWIGFGYCILVGTFWHEL